MIIILNFIFVTLFTETQYLSTVNIDDVCEFVYTNKDFETYLSRKNNIIVNYVTQENELRIAFVGDSEMETYRYVTKNFYAGSIKLDMHTFHFFSTKTRQFDNRLEKINIKKHRKKKLDFWGYIEPIVYIYSIEGKCFKYKMSGRYFI